MLMQKRLLLGVVLAGMLAGAAFYLYKNIYLPMRPTFARSDRLLEWLNDPSAHPDWSLRAGAPCSASAPFLFPTHGFVGYLWGDSFKVGKRHQGIDIFGGEEVGLTPIVAAYGGYLTRLDTWKSAVIVRVPADPLEPSRQIWLYYTHMADPYGNSFIVSEFPAGTYEKYIDAGTLLGYQGNYTGDAANPAGIHLHFSIVLDDGKGKFRNELDIRNTLDPSPYLGLPLNAAASDSASAFASAGTVVTCVEE